MTSKVELPDVPLAWLTLPSPIGSLTLVASAAGLVRVGFESDRIDSLLEDIEPSTDAVTLRFLAEGKTQLEEYFAGQRRNFTVPLVTGLQNGFRQKASEELEEVPYGQRVTYGELAARAGSPNAARAVGSMCANNPLPIFIPCHRVVRSDLTAGQYRGGSDAKDYLLRMEETRAGS